MCIIYTGNEEDIIYIDGMVFSLDEQYYNGTLIAYNLYLQGVLIDSYDSFELGERAVMEIIDRLNSGTNYININEINLVIGA